MNENEGFLKAILAHPDDDQLRLIYADWLEERGDPRGEFIRVQIELAGPNLDPQRERDLLIREKELLAGHEEEWLRPFRSLLLGWTFRRGFLDEVEMEAGTFLQHVPALCYATPIQALRVHLSGGLASEWVKCPYLARFRKLSFVARGAAALNDGGTEVLARSPFLESLQTLELPAGAVGLAAVRSLANAPGLSGLVDLRLNHNDIGDLGLQSLLASPYLSNLRHLHVSACSLSNTAATALARSEMIGQFETLILSHNDMIDNSGIRTLASSRRLGSLRVLRLGGLALNAVGIRSLAQCKFLANLSELDLSHTQVGDCGAELLADSPYLENLSWLNLFKAKGLTAMGKDRLQQRFASRVVL